MTIGIEDAMVSSHCSCMNFSCGMLFLVGLLGRIAWCPVEPTKPPNMNPEPCGLNIPERNILRSVYRTDLTISALAA